MAWHVQCVEREEDPANVVRVPVSVTRWHTALAVLHRSISDEGKKRRNEDPPPVFSWCYEPLSRDSVRGRGAPIRSSVATAGRALAFVQAVFAAGESRGVTCAIDRVEGRFALSLFGATLRFSVRERVHQEHRTHPLKGYDSNVRVEIPTGRLFLAIYEPNRYSFSSHAEGAEKTLSAYGNLLFQRLYSVVVDSREAARKDAEKRRRQEAVRLEYQRITAAREADAALRKEEARQQALERAREAALLREAEDWRAATLIREYIAAVGPAPTGESRAWVEWATGVAARLDPLPRRQGIE